MKLNTMQQSEPYTPQHIANFFLDRAQIERVNITPLKLVKLVYIAFGWVYAISGKKAFNETIQAWRFGPVIPSIYHEFKSFGRNPIDTPSTLAEYDNEGQLLKVKVPRVPESDTDITRILDIVWKIYSPYSATALVRKTHEHDTPWSRAFEESQLNKPISPSEIQEHFQIKIKEILSRVRDGKEA